MNALNLQSTTSVVNAFMHERTESTEYNISGVGLHA